MTPLHRPERFERYANPERVVRAAATRARNSLGRTATPGGATADSTVLGFREKEVP
jgi:hypothetical protein